jgi:hypothetical protein
MSDAMLMMGVTEAKAAAERFTSLDEQIDAAMNTMRNHWMILDEDLQFRCAVGALLLIVDEPTRQSIRSELNALKALSALMSGVPVDIERVEVGETLGLLKRWKELRKNA